MLSNPLRIFTCNVNSFNITEKGHDKFTKKILSILKTEHDIYFLQDLRLGDKSKTLKDFLNVTPHGNFDTFINSNHNARGAAIVINKKLNIEILNIRYIQNDNGILLYCLIEGNPFVLCSLYAPPDTKDKDFFNKIWEEIQQFKTTNIIFGGDCNTVLDKNRSNNNLDLWNALGFPNSNFNKDINYLIDNNLIVEPFRKRYPKGYAYSYHPFSGRNYKSRLDMFFLSPSLNKYVKNIEYLPRLLPIFDHSPVSLTLGRTAAQPKDFRINNNLIDILGLDILTKIEFLSNLPDYFEYFREKELKSKINYLRARQHELTEAIFSNLEEVRKDRLVSNLIKFKIFEIEQKLSEIPAWDIIRDIECDIEYDTLLCALSNNISLFISNIQSLYIKNKNVTYQNLCKQYNREMLLGNIAKLKIIETEIFEIEQEHIQGFLQNSIYFDQIKQEVLTKDLINLSKNKIANSSASLEDITDNNGLPFTNKTDKDKFISDYYKNIYKKKSTYLNIENFLGPELFNSDKTNNRKLSEFEKYSLEKPISIQELDEIVYKCTKKTAPGLDGWSYPLIKKFWPMLRNFVYLAFIDMISKGNLTYNFAQVKLKLIPKKGDLKNISNWRPISLISCFTKIMSSCINERLKIYMEKITGKEQKGFKSNRTIHSAILNIINDISYANRRKLEKSILLLDFSKAFDNISHEYIMTALEFFNFGPYMRSLVKLIITGKVGSIDLGDMLSPSFIFESGTGQGDPSSPTIFNICIAVLCIKLGNSPEYPLYGYADDITKLIGSNMAELRNCILILRNFHQLSGLPINICKSELIGIGNTRFSNLFLAEARETYNIKTTNKFRLLGIIIDNNLESLDENYNKLLTRLRLLILNWNRYNFKLMTRINIAKMFLLSQITYVATVVEYKKSSILDIEKLIINYIKGKDTVSKAKLNKNFKLGGLGFPDIFNFIHSIRCRYFIKHCNKDENWAVISRKTRIFADNIFSLNYGDEFKETYPATSMLLNSFNIFIKAFSDTNLNFIYTPILGNQNTCPTNGMGGNIFLPSDLSSIPNNNKFLINLSPSDIINCNNFAIKTKAELEISIGRQIKFVDFFLLRNIGSYFLKKIEAVPFSNKDPESIHEQCRKKTFDAKMIRTYLEGNRIDIPRHLKGIADLIGITINDQQYIDYFMTVKEKFLSLEMRIFNFKIFNNTLLTNDRLSNFDLLTEPECSYCKVIEYLTNNKENLVHLFIECKCLQHIYEFVFNQLLINRCTIGQNLTGSTANNFITRTGENIIFSYLNFFIYHERLKRRIPCLNALKDFFSGIMFGKKKPSLKNIQNYIKGAANVDLLRTD